MHEYQICFHLIALTRQYLSRLWAVSHLVVFLTVGSDYLVNG